MGLTEQEREAIGERVCFHCNDRDVWSAVERIVAAREAAARVEALRQFRRLVVRCYPKGLAPTATLVADLDERIAREIGGTR